MATDATVDGAISGPATMEMLDRRARRSVLAGAVFLALVAAWLPAAAALVDIEYYDGLSAICNARYFRGRSPLYLFDGGPLMGWLQMPAEPLKDWLGLHPLQVRPHHATMAVLNVGYLMVVYGAFVRHFGHGWSTLMAFATAITSFMFSSYAPFISHDILPGALFFLMLIWSEDIAAAPRIGRWLLLVAAGTLAALVKQTFGVFWIAVVLAQVVLTVLRRAERRDRTGWHRVVAGGRCGHQRRPRVGHLRDRARQLGARHGRMGSPLPQPSVPGALYPLQSRSDGRLLVAIMSTLSPREGPDGFTIRFFAIQRRTAPPAPAR